MPRANVTDFEKDGGFSQSLLTMSLLGGMRVSTPAGPLECEGKLGAFFASVAMAPGATLSRSALASLLWAEKQDGSAKHNLRQMIAKLKKLPCAGALVVSDGSVGLNTAVVSCDVWQFRALAASDVAQEVSQALESYRGPFCDGFSLNEERFSEWLNRQRAIIADEVLTTSMRIGLMEMAAGRPDLAIAHARRIIDIDDFREDAHRLLMQALVMMDRRAEAIRHYDGLAAMLEHEIDSEPDELTQALAVSLKQESSVSESTVPGASLTSGSTGWMLPHAEAALQVQTPSLLVVRPDIPSTDGGDDSAFVESCRQAARRFDLPLLADGQQEVVVLARSVREGVTLGQSILKSTATLHARMGLHTIESMDPSAKMLDRSRTVARQLCRLAAPGKLFVSVEAREHIISVLDGTCVDLGETALPAHRGPLRAFDVYPVDAEQPLDVQAPLQDLMPAIAIIPFTTFTTEAPFRFLGDLLADEMISSLAKNIDLRVISRMSTSALAGRQANLRDILSSLGAAYAATGTCYVLGSKIRLNVEFVDLASHQLIFSETLECPVAEALALGGIVDGFASRMVSSIMRSELRRARLLPFSSLANSTLMLGAITLMHQLSRPRFELARTMIENLIDRDRKHPMPYAWLAMHRLLKVSQGWTDNAEKEAALASDESQRALDLEPDNSLALAVDAHIHTQFRKDLSGAEHRLTASLESNPSNGLAWLFKSTMHAFKGEGASAIQAANQAARLSPLDPRRWFYDSLGATAALGAEDYDEAIRLAQRSVQANAAHISTYRALAIAQSLSGRLEDARQTVQKLMQAQPDLTASGYRAQHPTGFGGVGSMWAEALRNAGVPT